MSAITAHYGNVIQLWQSESFCPREYKREEENIDELLLDLQVDFAAFLKPGDVTPAICSDDPSGRSPLVEISSPRLLEFAQ